ncbi:hypothetical protein CAJAP_03915 [Camponotus japonicus]
MAVLAREEERRRASQRETSPELGGRSKGGLRRAQLLETPAPAGPAGGERGPRPKAGERPSSSAPKKGSTDDGGGGRAGRLPLRGSATDRPPSVQRGIVVLGDASAVPGLASVEAAPPPKVRKKRDLRERYKTY